MNPFKQMLDAAEADVLKLEALATRAENAVTRIFAAKALFSSSAATTDTVADSTEADEATSDAAADNEAEASDQASAEADDASDDTTAEAASTAAGTATVAVAENPQTAAAS